MLEFIKQIAQENNIKVSDNVLKRAALILESENHKSFFFDEEEEGLAPWVNNIITLIHTCNQNCEALYIKKNHMYPTTNPLVAVEGAIDLTRQDGSSIKIYRVTEEDYTWYATSTLNGVVYAK